MRRQPRCQLAGQPPRQLPQPHLGAALPGAPAVCAKRQLWLWQGDSGRQLTSTGDAIQPAWSPDGTRIAYVRRVNSASDLLLLPAEGTGAPTQLTDNSPDPALYSYDRIYNSVWAFYPAWSPDGVTLAYASGSLARPATRGGQYLWRCS